MKIKGLIHFVDIENKIIGISAYKRIKFFYFQNSQMNIFKRYLYSGNFIELEYNETNLRTKNKYTAYVVDFVYQLYSTSQSFYDKKNINYSLKNFLKSLGNILVLDLEMTMPDYNKKGQPFKAELIQAGFVVIDTNGEEIERYSNYVKPTLAKTISKRVEDFLKISIDDFNYKAISYDKFYDDYKEIIENYNPTILVYGKNDIKVLTESYEINHKEPINNRFVNLCQLVKNYYDLKNDPGLFRLYKVYYGSSNEQVHDAFDDCEVTARVFSAFKKDVEQLSDSTSLIRKTFM